ncbi:MAG: hypothetical protein ACRC50_13015 [Gaiella sp.]
MRRLKEIALAVPESGASTGTVLLAALGRLVVLLGASIALVLLLVLPFGLLLGASANRAISLGLYLLGCFLMIAGFFVGNRGPFRAEEGPETPRLGRRLRSASRSEMLDSIAVSAVFIVLGVILIALGAAIDSRADLV